MKQFYLSFRIAFLAGLFTLLGFQQVQSQNLLYSEAYGRYQYIYKISNDDAKAFYKSKKAEVKPEYFKTLVDSFPYGQTYNKPLKPGHYLKVSIVNNTLQTTLAAVHNFEIYLLNNDTDLNIRILDKKGEHIKNARVKLGNKKIAFEDNTQCYSIKRSYKKGILTVSVGESVAYYNLERSEKGGLFIRKLNQTLYDTPVEYIWRPIYFVVDIPVSAYKSIRDGQTSGSISGIERFAVNTYESFMCLFDNSYCRDRRFREYSVTDKPRYRPNDTLKFKAFVLKQNFKPFNEELDLYLSESFWGGGKKITSLKPYRKGGYTFNLQLSDTLNLKLDNEYFIVLKDKKKRKIAAAGFRYSEYTLKGNTVELYTKEDVHYKGDTLKLDIKALDENELFLMDARAEILLTSSPYGEYFEKKLFIPDTLWTHETPLKPREKTTVSIPPSIFPKANFRYTIRVLVRTADNEIKKQAKSINYIHEVKEIVYKEQNDTLSFNYQFNGENTPKTATVYTTNHIGVTDTLTGIALPYKVKLNPSFTSYTVKTDSLSQTVSVKKILDKVSLSYRRTNDSLHVKLYNPRELDVVYTLYKVNKEIARGHAKTLDLHIEAEGTKNYMLSLAYIWGGETVKKNQPLNFNETELNLDIKEPTLVYPGKKDTIRIRITDYKNEPVENVDVTAFGLTKKFNYQLPLFPQMYNRKKSKYVVNNYSENKNVYNTHEDALDYLYWKEKANLDSIVYYNFMYPKDIFITDVKPKEKITQFAPFVMSDGEQIPIHVIYVNNNPVYFDWNTPRQQYSFKIDSGYQNIKLRTYNRSYEIDSLYFKPDRKTIFSLDENTNHPNVTIKELDYKLTSLEKNELYPRILVYHQPWKRNQAYIESRGRFYNIDNLNARVYYKYGLLTGPVYDKFVYQDSDSLTYTIDHKPGYAYTFGPDNYELESYENHYLPKVFIPTNLNETIYDQVTTLRQIHQVWKEQNIKARKKRFSISYPTRTEKGFAKLRLENKNTAEGKELLNIIIANTQTDEVRVYKGKGLYYHQLKPETHRIIVLYDDMTYQVIENIDLKPNGLNVVQIREPEMYMNDFFSQAMNEIIDKYGLKTYSEENQRLINNYIESSYQRNLEYFGPGTLVSGYVVDENDLPLPSVFVQVKGTNMGTTTDFDGNFVLKVPNTKSTLVYKYTGYKTLERRATKYNKISLELDVSTLDEVVITTYPVIPGKTAVSSAKASSELQIEEIPLASVEDVLAGKVAGANVSMTSGQPGQAATVVIRGRTSMQKYTEPLYIIDGMPVNANNFAKLMADDIESMQVLKDAAATSIYGNRGAAGVIVITTKSKDPDIVQEGQAELPDVFMEQNEEASSIRSNFSDVAYWQPTLRTDKNGEVQFVVTYPDDITSWQNVVLAMNGKRQKGKYTSFTNSYKPVSARLYVPKFLIEGDKLTAIGKTLNYTKDTLTIDTDFAINGKTVFTKSYASMNAIIDSLPVLATTDTLQLTYKLKQQNSDYFDGEKRDIPVFKKGVELQKGIFKILEPGDTLSHTFDFDGPLQFYAEANAIDLIERDIETIVNYKYECNEQLASKLKMLLLQKRTDSILGRNFSQEKDIKKIIRKLNKSKTENGLWGWWKSSPEVSYWISQHVIEAFLLAEENGYKTDLDKEKVKVYLKNKFIETPYEETKAQLLFTLSKLGERPYPDQLNGIKQKLDDSLIGLHTRLKFALALQNLKLNPDLSFIDQYESETIFGSLYFDDYHTKSQYRVYQNANLNTLMAYQLIRRKNPQDKRLSKIRNYLLESKQSARNLNTYQTTQILEAIMPDMLKANTSESSKASLMFNGTSISEFPFNKDIDSKTMALKNTGNFPVYVTAYQGYWETNPSKTSDEFEVNSYFKDRSDMRIENGEEVKLVVDVNVKKKAEYIMLEVPIPAGFEYASKPVNYRLEDHREYFKEKVSIFSSGLDEGEYKFEIPLIAKYSGSYNLNPAKIELMYFPTFNAHEGLKMVEVK